MPKISPSNLSPEFFKTLFIYVFAQANGFVNPRKLKLSAVYKIKEPLFFTSISNAFSKKSTIHFSYCLENIFSLFINRNAIQIKRRYFNFFCRIIYKTYKNLLT